ncbi:MAG: GNAT family N-acetyltransferase [Candidatus Latescibacterota bacterium]
MGPLPTGYRLRGYQPGDDEEWARLLQANGELGEWDVERVRGELRGPLVRQGQRFVVWGAQIVATAGVYQRERDGAPALEIGWVAAHPEHRGRRLGELVTAAAVGAALCLPPQPIYLLTDDHRLPALKVYLRLGFTPDLSHPSCAERWRLILEHLGPQFAAYRGLLLGGAGGAGSEGARG